MDEYAVTIIHSFDPDVETVSFEDYDTARAYLHWIWEDYYNTEIKEVDDFNKEDSYHEECYAKISYYNGDKTEFILSGISEPDERFEDINIERYL